MILYVNIKQIGKRKNKIKRVPFTYDVTPNTLRELIEETVKICVNQFTERLKQGESVLSNEEISDMAYIGKVAFGILYNQKNPNIEEAIETAITGFQDGLFRVFLQDEELTLLDEKLEIGDEMDITFIRLTMLAGRMW